MVTLHQRRGWQARFAVRADDVSGLKPRNWTGYGTIVTMVDGTTHEVRESVAAISAAMSA